MRKLWLVLVLCSAVALLPLDGQPAQAKVWFFDIGQGDASLIALPGSYQVLIDGGPDNKVLAGLGKAMPSGDRTIELAILSHPHADHYRGLREVIARFRILTLWVSGVKQDNADYQDFVKAALTSGTSIEEKAKSTLPITNGSLEVLYPDQLLTGTAMKNLNNASLVVLVKLRDVRILFPGDAEMEEEKAIVEKLPELRADVLKAPHHGSRTSSTKDFLAAARPKDTVISVGARNRYGHPHRQTLANIERSGSRLYRTDRQGIVVMTLKEKGYEMKSER